MRKLLWLSIVAIVPACGCECITEPIRRIEVWKLQTFFTAPTPVTIAPPGAVCGPAQPVETGCGGSVVESGCGGPSAMPAVTGFSPESVSPDSSEETIPGPILTEEGDGVLKQP
jgi:hypothetical protein